MAEATTLQQSVAHGAGEAGPLGKYTKSSTPPPDDRSAIRASRAERYYLLSSARALFLGAGKQAGLEYPANFHRTAKCRHVTHEPMVGIHRARDSGGAFYSGLMLCGSVWTCPVCAAKVQERRREEIAQAIDWAYVQGFQPVMVTLTFPHRSWHSLSDLLGRQADAFKRLRAGSPWSRFKESVGFEGLIRSLELTYGKHGWHPHTHEMWFVRADVEAADLQKRVLERWRAACSAAGLLDMSDDKQVRAFDERAVDVKGWCTASDYLAKQDESRHWGADREMAKASSKGGRAKGLHPFALLAEYAEKDLQSGRVFLEYAAAIHGKAQIFWSPGLKARVGVEQKSDEQLAEESRSSADELGALTREDWRTVREARQQAQVLDAAEVGGMAAVEALLQKLTTQAIEKLQALLAGRRGDAALPPPLDQAVGGAAAKPSEGGQPDDPDARRGRGGAATLRAAKDQRQRRTAERGRPSGR